MQTLTKISVLACCLVSALASVASARKWTDAKGEVIANDAKFVRVFSFKEKDSKSPSGAPSSTTSGGKSGEIRVLLDFKGRPINKPFLELSTEDQQFIREELDRKKLSEQLALLPAPTATGQPGAMPGMQQPGVMPGMQQPAVNPGAAPPAGAEERIWTSTKGTQLKARFLQVDGDKVVLIAAEGTRKEVPIAQLSDADQAYVRTAAATPPTATPVPGGTSTTMPQSVPPTGTMPGSGPGPGPGDVPPTAPTTSTTPGSGPGPGPGGMPPAAPATGTTPGSGPGPGPGDMPPTTPTTGTTPGSGPGPVPGGMPPTTPTTSTTPGSGPGPGPGGMPPTTPTTGTAPSGQPGSPSTPVPPPSTSSPPIASTVTSPPATGWATWLLIVVGVVCVGLGGLVGYVIRDRMNTPQPKRR